MVRELKKNRTIAFFSMIMLVAGLAAAFASTGSAIVDYFGSRDWVEVPATIHSVSLDTSQGEDTYTVNSRYSYSYKGDSYQGDKVDLHFGKTSSVKYATSLERSLLALQKNNEASVIINPRDPTQSVLARRMNWRPLAIGALFATLFPELVALLLWLSQRRAKTQSYQPKHKPVGGINSKEKTASWSNGGLGCLFLVIGVVVSVIILPDALRQGEYIALVILLFVLFGAGLIYHAFKISQAYRWFGPTSLFLNPASPGVGGQLGGHFSINGSGISQSMTSAAQLQATLKCTRRRRTRKKTYYDIEWETQSPVDLKDTANGMDALFLFEIPKSCSPTSEQLSRSSIGWSVTVAGEIGHSGLTKFERNWPVVVE